MKLPLELKYISALLNCAQIHPLNFSSSWIVHFVPSIAGQCLAHGVVDIRNSRGGSHDKSGDESQNVWCRGENQSRRGCFRSSLQNQAEFGCQTVWRLDHASDKGSSGRILIEKVGLKFRMTC